MVSAGLYHGGPPLYDFGTNSSRGATSMAKAEVVLKKSLTKYGSGTNFVIILYG